MKPNLDSQFRANVLCAGSSAVLLAFAHVHAGLWFLALFALVPFLWRLASVGRRQAAMQGVMLATCFVLATSAGQLATAPVNFVTQLAALNVVFALFGYAINRLSVRLGFNPLLIALIWFPLGLLLAQVVNLGDALLFGQAGPELLLGFGSLAGLLFWSTVVVLINGLILLLARFIKRQLIRRSTRSSSPSRRVHISTEVPPRTAHWGLIPSFRAPPLLF